MRPPNEITNQNLAGRSRNLHRLSMGEEKARTAGAGQLNCQRCGIGFTSPHSRPKRILKFCSSRCWYEWKRGQTPRQRKCIICGEMFDCVGKTYTKTCSWKCRGLSYRKRKTVSCLRCGKDFEWYPSGFDRRFCSRKCGHAHTRNQVGVKCLECGKRFMRTACFVRRVKRVFCSKECFKAHNRGQRSPLWRSGGPTSDRGSDWKKESIAARKRDDLTCQVCREKKKMSQLHVDHIVPFRLVNRNDAVNLISLCNRCHTRKTQMERYLLKGDMVSFKQKLNLRQWPMDRVEAALAWWGSL